MLAFMPVMTVMIANVHISGSLASVGNSLPLYGVNFTAAIKLKIKIN
jgi:hypothetical protein